MKLQFFGSDDEPLFGAYHPPARGGVSNRAAVLCCPAGHEYFKAHRAFRLLARQLARQGVHVWRFDYYGTGDSAGETGAGDVDRWVQDVRLAISAVMERSPARTVSLVGLRLGATVAALAAARDTRVGRLVLWDPVLSGGRYVDELVGLTEDPQSDAARVKRGGVVTVTGYPWKSEVLGEISKLNLAEVLRGYLGELGIVSSQPLPPEEVDRLSEGSASSTECEVLPDPRAWCTADQEQLVPQPAIRWVTARVAQD